MKQIKLFFIGSLIFGLLTACKNDKAAGVEEKTKELVASVGDAVGTVKEEAQEVIEKTTEAADAALENLDVKSKTAEDSKSIGTKELEELKKAEAEEKRKPKVRKKGSLVVKVPEDPKPSSPSGVDRSSEQSSSEPITESANTNSVDEPAKPKSLLKEVQDKVTTTTKNDKPKKVEKVIKPASAETKKTEMGTQVKEINHEAFNTLLSKFVSGDGVVDYTGLKASGRALNAYCQNLTDNPPKDSWTKNEKLAYWLNAYNAFTLKLITDNFPLGSITDLEGGKPWDKKWISIGDQTLSLNGIENDIIRPRFGDPRIHFGLNCAAKSCPKLANYAFTAKNVDSKLSALTKTFINSGSNKLAEDEISISKIFDWYKEDFGDVVTYINKYSSVRINPNAKVAFMDYDWSLNGK